MITDRYKAKSLTTNSFVEGSLTIIHDKYYGKHAIIHTTDFITEEGEENNGSWTFYHENIVVDINTIEKINLNNNQQKLTDEDYKKIKKYIY